MTLLSADVVVELMDGDRSSTTSSCCCETLCGVEFLVRHTNVSVPAALLSSWAPDACTVLRPTGSVSEADRLFGPALRLYAPLGGFLSAECRAVLCRGLASRLTRLALLRLCDVSGLTQSASLRNMRWSPSLLRVIAADAGCDPAALCFTAELPASATLLPLATGLRQAVPGATAHVYRLRFAVSRMTVVAESARDKDVAGGLAVALARAHLWPAEFLRETGGEALQGNNFRDAAACYTRMLAQAQKGLRYPYRHALRPPQSFEDRGEGDEDDIADDNEAPMPLCETETERRDIAPAHRVFEGLLRLQRGTEEEEEEVRALYESDVLAGARWLFPRSHALLHVWYTLHRMAVAGAANAAHALLLITAKSNTLVKELHQRNAQASQWCGRAVALLRRFRSWCGDEVLGNDPSSPGVSEWVWLRTIEFKLQLRRSRLLLSVGDVDESRRVLHEMQEHIRLLSSNKKLTSLLGGVLLDASTQLSVERARLRDEENQSSGLSLRL